jgi:hypothetical protein
MTLEDHTLGDFWIAELPDVHLPGSLDVTHAFPQVQVAGQLTEAFEWKQINETTWRRTLVDTDFEPEDFHIHGELSTTRDKQVTLYNSITVSREYQGFGRLTAPSKNGSQRLQGTWLVHGEHLAKDEIITGALLRFSNIDAWIGDNGTKTVLHTQDPRRKVDINYEMPPTKSATIPSTCAKVSTSFMPEYPKLDWNGAEVRQESWLKFEDLNENSLGQLYENYISPTLSLASVMLDRRCWATELHILTEKSDNYLRVYHPLLKPTKQQSPINRGSYYLSLSHISMKNLAEWIAQAKTLEPVPGIVVSSIDSTGGNGKTVESTLLELAACAEGLDRRLHDSDPIFRQEIANTARKAALEAVRTTSRGELREELVRRVEASLSHFNEATYDERLQRLINLVEECAPETFGDPDKWKTYVKNARNGYAHLLNKPGHAWQINLILSESLKWIIGCIILLQSGIPASVIKDRLHRHQKYLNFTRRAKSLAREIYTD